MSTTGMISDRESAMQLGMIGLGRMGANMVRRLVKGGHHCVVLDRSPKVVKQLAEEKAVGASSFLLWEAAGERNSSSPAKKPA
jgi:6-phosphogluconate dehydrogenase (decarboxylating)